MHTKEPTRDIIITVCHQTFEHLPGQIACLSDNNEVCDVTGLSDQ